MRFNARKIRLNNGKVRKFLCWFNLIPYKIIFFIFRRKNSQNFERKKLLLTTKVTLTSHQISFVPYTYDVLHMIDDVTNLFIYLLWPKNAHIIYFLFDGGASHLFLRFSLRRKNTEHHFVPPGRFPHKQTHKLLNKQSLFSPYVHSFCLL